MSHLGERVSDLVDGRLEPEAAESAHAHMVSCQPCHQLVDAERLIGSRLRALPDPEPDQSLVARLLAVPQLDTGLDAGAATRSDQESDLEVAAPPPTARRSAGPPARAGQVPLDGGPTGSRRPGVSTRPAGSSPAVAPARSGRLSRRPGRVRLAAAVAGSVGAVSAGLLGLSVLSATANAAVMPTLDMLAARHVVTMSGLPILNIAPAWRMANQVAGR